MPDEHPTTRRTRFVCISDTHNACPGGAFKLPRGDVLICAGDMTNQGSYSELKRTIDWLEEADFEKKIVIAGNHDITLDTEFYSQHGLYFHNQTPQDPAKCQELLEQSSSITWLKHDSAVINLTSPFGPRTTFKIFGSPYSPADGMWAFGYSVDEAKHIWDCIPLDADIVLTHTPPKYHCDEKRERKAAGCESLREALWRIRPKLAICGHVHDGRGAERIRWDLGASNVKYREDGVERWEDPGRDNKKISLVDLTAKGRRPIDNDGSVGDLLAASKDGVHQSLQYNVPVFHSNGNDLEEPWKPMSKTSTVTGISRPTANPLTLPPESLSSATQGQGGEPPSQRCDLAALSGRLGRKETCIVNAAIAASNYPHTGGRKFNKPIVVDIDLPVYED
ncbi:Metallo-dependent phosphatase-like protein [Rhexocercosporidium sp. MPI-PUGE-AT-0058]|nr:Metallo-dependent phosphatase-like protein [Rhexocercosporidium sp. MPI-PUGE-AT-0058]